MNASEKIERLLEITGTPIERRELARFNYSKLLEKEGEGILDARLEEFEAMHRDVTHWRESRTKESAPPTQAPKESAPSTQPPTGLATILVREKIAVRRVEALIDKLALRLAHLQNSNDRPLGNVEKLDKKLRDIGAALNKLDYASTNWDSLYPYSFAHPLSLISRTLLIFSDALAVHKRYDLRSAIDKQTEVIEKIYERLGEASDLFKIPPHEKKIDTEQAISGLGGLAAYVSEYQPDVIFAINDGGLTVGAFIKEHLNLSVPVVVLRGNVEGVGTHSREETPKTVRRPIVVDDVSRTGGTLTQAFAWIGRRYPGIPPRAATMAASVSAIELLGQDHLHTPNPTQETTIRMPYDSRAGFKVVGNSAERLYVFGAAATTTEGRLIVPAETVDKVVAERNRAFLIDADN